MKTVELSQATGPLADYVGDVEAEPLVITVDGQPVAALVATGELDLETLAMSTNPAFLALIERSRTRQRTEGGLTSDQVREQLGITPSSPDA
jgi:antitoxin (DNA-binding transcriptional repressor) of toxin-antitoxin stability system